MRRLFAAVVVLLLSGLLPLAAATGFCAAKPCCHPHTDAGTPSLATTPECCGTTASFSARRAEATNTRTAGVGAQLVAAESRVQPVLRAISVPNRRDIETGSLHPRQRLATLSILLI